VKDSLRWALISFFIFQGIKRRRNWPKNDYSSGEVKLASSGMERRCDLVYTHYFMALWLLWRWMFKSFTDIIFAGIGRKERPWRDFDSDTIFGILLSSSESPPQVLLSEDTRQPHIASVFSLLRLSRCLQTACGDFRVHYGSSPPRNLISSAVLNFITLLIEIQSFITEYHRNASARFSSVRHNKNSRLEIVLFSLPSALERLLHPDG
jgi:hypothetical protein